MPASDAYAHLEKLDKENYCTLVDNALNAEEIFHIKKEARKIELQPKHFYSQPCCGGWYTLVQTCHANKELEIRCFASNDPECTSYIKELRHKMYVQHMFPDDLRFRKGGIEKVRNPNEFF